MTQSLQSVYHRCSPLRQLRLWSFFLQNESPSWCCPQTLMSLVCRISSSGDIIRRNYCVPLPVANEGWQASLLSPLPNCMWFPETGKYCLDLTLSSFPHLHLQDCCNFSAMFPCPMHLESADAAVVVTAGCHGCLWGAHPVKAWGGGSPMGSPLPLPPGWLGWPLAPLRRHVSLQAEKAEGMQCNGSWCLPWCLSCCQLHLCARLPVMAPAWTLGSGQSRAQGGVGLPGPPLCLVWHTTHSVSMVGYLGECCCCVAWPGLRLGLGLWCLPCVFVVCRDPVTCSLWMSSLQIFCLMEIHCPMTDLGRWTWALELFERKNVYGIVHETLKSNSSWNDWMRSHSCIFYSRQSSAFWLYNTPGSTALGRAAWCWSSWSPAACSSSMSDGEKWEFAAHRVVCVQPG